MLDSRSDQPSLLGSRNWRFDDDDLVQDTLLPDQVSELSRKLGEEVESFEWDDSSLWLSLGFGALSGTGTLWLRHLGGVRSITLQG